MIFVLFERLVSDRRRLRLQLYLTCRLFCSVYRVVDYYVKSGAAKWFQDVWTFVFARGVMVPVVIALVLWVFNVSFWWHVIGLAV